MPWVILVQPSALEAQEAECPQGDVLIASEFPSPFEPAVGCPLSGRVVRDGQIRLVIPEAGRATAGFVLSRTTDSDSFAILVEEDGTIFLLGVGITPLSIPRRGGLASFADTSESEGDSDLEEAFGPGNITGNECTDGYFQRVGWHESDQHQWFLNVSSIPAYLNQAEAVARIREGGSHVTHFDTDCSFTPTGDISIAYQGSTTRGVNLEGEGSSVTCSPQANRYDGANVVGFGNLPSNLVAVTCVDEVDLFSEVSEADTRFNRDDYSFFASNNSPSPCNDRIDLEGVTTHERGHVFGLDDVSRNAHPNLTMRNRVDLANCSRDLRSLGLGDLGGLDLIY